LSHGDFWDWKNENSYAIKTCQYTGAQSFVSFVSATFHSFFLP
jgi:hypothetical protein